MNYVLYHGNCPDGFGAALAAWIYLGDDDTQFIPVNYGQPPPRVKREDAVYILDFSYSRKTLKDLACQVSKLVLLDHHKTARAELEGLQSELGPHVHITFDMESSGAVLAWKFFHPGEPIPKLMLYLQDRDLWKFDLPKSREISMVVRHLGFHGAPTRWLDLQCDMEDPSKFEALVGKGKLLLEFMNSQVSVMARNARIQEVAGVLMPVCNATVFFSEVGKKLLELYPDHPVAGYYFDRDDKRQWGLRSRQDYDCSILAKAMGGGGHAQSSGFTQEIPK